MSLITPQMRQAARVVHADAEPFATIQSGVTDYPLTIHGKRLRRLLNFESLYRTDWQGRVALSDQPRTNYAPSSDFSSGVNNNGGGYTVTPSESLFGGKVKMSELADNGNWPVPFINYRWGALPANSTGVFSYTMYLLAGRVTHCIVAIANNTGYTEIQSASIISGPGVMTFDTLSGLSASEPTCVGIKFALDGSQPLWSGIRVSPVNAGEGESVVAGGVMLTPGDGAFGAYIPTFGQPASATDFSRATDTISLADISGGGYWTGLATHGSSGELTC